MRVGWTGDVSPMNETDLAFLNIYEEDRNEAYLADDGVSSESRGLTNRDEPEDGDI